MLRVTTTRPVTAQALKRLDELGEVLAGDVGSRSLDLAVKVAASDGGDALDCGNFARSEARRLVTDLGLGSVVVRAISIVTAETFAGSRR